MRVKEKKKALQYFQLTYLEIETQKLKTPHLLISRDKKAFYAI